MQNGRKPLPSEMLAAVKGSNNIISICTHILILTKELASGGKTDTTVHIAKSNLISSTDDYKWVVHCVPYTMCMGGRAITAN